MWITNRKVYLIVSELRTFIARVAGPLSIRYGNTEEKGKKQIAHIWLNAELKRQFKLQIIWTGVHRINGTYSRTFC
jgi:hypothetical protein